MFRIGLLVITALSVVNAEEFETEPMNMAAKKGESVTFECRVQGEPFVEWRMYDGPSSDKRIYDSNDGVKDARFDVDTSQNGRHDLIVKDVQDDVAVKYACKFPLSSDDKSSEAHLVAVGDVECPEDGTTLNEGDNMELRCEVSYTEYMYQGPMLDWYDEDGTNIPGEVQTDPDKGISLLSINMTADAASDELMYHCNVTFETMGDDKDAPEYTDSCHTHFLINHPPTNIQFDPSPDNDGTLEVETGTYINCTASGRPAVTYIWYDENDSEAMSGSSLPITLDMIGRQHTYECIARNTFNGEERQTQRQISFTAVEGSTSSSPIMLSNLIPAVVIAVLVTMLKH